MDVRIIHGLGHIQFDERTGAVYRPIYFVPLAHHLVGVAAMVAQPPVLHLSTVRIVTPDAQRQTGGAPNFAVRACSHRVDVHPVAFVVEGHFMNYLALCIQNPQIAVVHIYLCAGPIRKLSGRTEIRVCTDRGLFHGSRLSSIQFMVAPAACVGIDLAVRATEDTCGGLLTLLVGDEDMPLAGSRVETYHLCRFQADATVHPSGIIHSQSLRVYRPLFLMDLPVVCEGVGSRIVCQ